MFLQSAVAFFPPLYTISGSLTLAGGGGVLKALGRYIVLFNGYIYSTIFCIISSVLSLQFVLKPCFAPKTASESKQPENRKVTIFLCNLLLYAFFWAALNGLWDNSSPIRD